MPIALDLKTFVPSKDYDLSIQFYLDMGWTMNWKTEELSEMEIADRRFYLQNYYHKGWANNFMLYVDVENAQDWYEHALEVLKSNKYGKARTKPPQTLSYGIATHVWDPAGVLLHFVQGIK